MSAIRKDPPYVTLEAFLSWDDGTDTRYELLRGEVVAMAPPRAGHSQLSVAIGAGLLNRLRRPCTPYGDAGIFVRGLRDTFFVADIVVSCSHRDPAALYIDAPVLIVEILSPSTRTHDRSVKLPAYRTIASVQDIVLASATEIAAEHWRRDGTGWHVEDLKGPDAVLDLQSLGTRLLLDDIYRGIELEKEPEAAPEAEGQPGDGA